MSRRSPALKPSAFLESLIRFLMPFFIGTAVDIDAARSEILETLAAYETRTRAEMLIAAQIIAFGMSTLDTLAEAKEAELSPSMRIRFRGCANGLNRSTLQNEKALDQRLAHELPHTAGPMPEPVNDTEDADVQAAIDQTRAIIDSYRSGLSSSRPPAATPLTETEQERSKQLWAAAMLDMQQQMGLPIGPMPGG